MKLFTNDYLSIPFGTRQNPTRKMPQTVPQNAYLQRTVTAKILLYLHSVNGHKTNSQKNPQNLVIPPGVCEVINTVHYKIQQNNFKDFAKVYSFV